MVPMLRGLMGIVLCKLRSRRTSSSLLKLVSNGKLTVLCTLTLS